MHYEYAYYLTTCSLQQAATHMDVRMHDSGSRS